MDIPMILAGPIFAVQAERFLAGRRERRERKLVLFRTLMASRVARAADPRHTEALNLIGIEFYEEKAVIGLWRDYIHHMNSGQVNEAWMQKWTDLFIELLYAIAQSLDFKQIDKTQIRETYAPVLYETLEKENTAIRQGLIAVLAGRTSISVRPNNDPVVSPEDFHKMQPTFVHPMAVSLPAPPKPKPGEKL